MTGLSNSSVDHAKQCQRLSVAASGMASLLSAAFAAISGQSENQMSSQTLNRAEEALLV